MLIAAATWCKRDDKYSKMVLFVLILQIINFWAKKVNRYLSWIILYQINAKKSDLAKFSETLQLNCLIIAQV